MAYGNELLVCAPLPVGVVIQVLQKVPLHHRLCCCALVSTSWAEAAAAATTSIELSGCVRPETLLAWLDQHGQLTQLRASSFHSHGRQPFFSRLPCKLLSDLHLYGCRVQLTPTLLQPGILGEATSLTRLSLHVVGLMEGPLSLAGLSALPALQHLDLMDLWNQTVPDSIFLQLQLLTHLKVGRGIAVQTLQHLGHLTRLRRLILGCLWPPGGQAVGGLEAMSQLQHLTWLALPGVRGPLIPAALQSIHQLTRLQHLELQGAEGSIEITLLAPLAQLQHLDLYNTVPQAGSAGAAALFALLSSLRQLTHLNVAYSIPQPAPTAAAYEALTASPGLQHLALTCSHTPSTAWQHFLAPPKQLHNLTSLELHHVDAGSQPQQGLLDLTQVVQCCSNLQNLDLSMLSVISPVTLQLSALLQLPRLRSLTLHHVEGEAAAVVLSQLTGLVELRVWPPSSLSDAGVLQLTALRQLTVLYCPPVTGSLTHWLTFRNKAPSGVASDVWSQLLACCAASPAL